MTQSLKPKNRRGGRLGVSHRTHNMQPNSLKNLIPLTKGHNNHGNHEGYSLRAELKHALVKEKRLLIVNSTIEGAILREPTPFKELWDRVDGRMPQPVSGEVDVTHTINIIVSSEKARELTENVAKRLAERK